MTLFDDVSTKAKEQFPNIQVKFKSESTFMRILGAILFFNPAFMKEFVTTIGNSIYFPTKDYTANSSVDASVVLLHELVHIYDSQKKSKFIFSLLYLMPQILVLLFIPLLFLFGWKIALLSLIFLAPFPAYFRMVSERRAYTISAYVMNKLANQGYSIDFVAEKQFYVDQFKGSSYYFMWPFNSIETYFNNIINQFKSGTKSKEIEPEIYGIIDKILP